MNISRKVLEGNSVLEYSEANRLTPEVWEKVFAIIKGGISDMDTEISKFLAPYKVRFMQEQWIAYSENIDYSYYLAWLRKIPECNILLEHSLYSDDVIGIMLLWDSLPDEKIECSIDSLDFV